LLVVFAALLLASTVLVAGLASAMPWTQQGNGAVRSLDPGGGELLCVPPAGAGNCPGHCVQGIKWGEQDVALGTAVATVAARAVPPRMCVPVGPGRLVVASAPPVVGPRLTILFHNLRN